MTKSSEKVIKINQESHKLCTFNTKVFKSSCEFNLISHETHKSCTFNTTICNSTCKFDQTSHETHKSCTFSTKVFKFSCEFNQISHETHKSCTINTTIFNSTCKFDQISHETQSSCKVYHQNQFYTPKKQTSKQPTFPKSCHPSGNQLFKQLFVLINKLQIHANYTSQLRMWPLFSLSNWQLCLTKCPTAQTV